MDLDLQSVTPSGREPREREPLWRDLIGEVLRRERQAQEDRKSVV